MLFDKDDETTPHEDLSSEQISGAKIGFAIVAVMSICIILGLTLPVFCPHTYERLRAIAYIIMGDSDDNHSSSDDED
jgi:hypothetical protein